MTLCDKALSILYKATDGLPLLSRKEFDEKEQPVKSIKQQKKERAIQAASWLMCLGTDACHLPADESVA